MNNPLETVKELLLENLEDKNAGWMDVSSLLVLNLKQMVGEGWREDLDYFSFDTPRDMEMNLRRFWEYYKPVVDALNQKDFDKAIIVLDKMVSQEGICDRWKQLMLRFVSAGGEVPFHLDAMMLLGDSDDWLKEYVARKKEAGRRSRKEACK